MVFTYGEEVNVQPVGHMGSDWCSRCTDGEGL